MSGRGLPLPSARGGRSSQQQPSRAPLHYSAFETTRGRGRPHRFKLASHPRMPSGAGGGARRHLQNPHQNPEEEEELEDVIEDSGEFRGDVVGEEEIVEASEGYYQEEGEEEHLEPEVVEEGEIVEEAVDPVKMEKIKQIQHQKMLLVTPMAQKRLRGRPPTSQRGGSSSGGLMEEGGGLLEDHNDDDDEEEMLRDSESGGGPLEDVVTSSESQIQNPESKESTHPPPAPRHLLNKANSRGRPANPIPPHRRPLPKDLMPPPPPVGIQNLKRGGPGGPGPSAKRRGPSQNPQNPPDDHPPLLHPPRGGPVSHLVAAEAPEGLEDVTVKMEESEACGPTEDHPGRGSLTAQNGPEGGPRAQEAQNRLEALEPAHEEDRAPEAIEEVTISQQDSEEGPEGGGLPKAGPDTKAVQKKAGLDLPAEHFPKDPAGHVITRGIHPISADKVPMAHLMTYEHLEHHDLEQDLEDQDLDHDHPQERVLTLQNGAFIDDRIGRMAVDEEEDEDGRGPRPRRSDGHGHGGRNSNFITVQEEDGVNVVYEVEEADPEDVNEEEYVLEEEIQNPRILKVEEEELLEHQGQQEDDEDDDLPPQLIPEVVQDGGGEKEEHQQQEEEEMNYEFNMLEDENQYNFCAQDGRQVGFRVVRDEQGQSIFVDEQGRVVQLMTETGVILDPSEMGPNDQILDDDGSHGVEHIGGLGEQKAKGELVEEEEEENVLPTENHQRANMDFMSSCNFLDSNNICCGLCGEIVQYDKLISEHLPHAHPETQTQDMQLEEVPYHSWLKERLQKESKIMENGFRNYDDHHHGHGASSGGGFGGAARLYHRSIKQMRKVSQIRVNVNEMSMVQLENALKRKLIEKMGRKVPVSLVDRLHARCDICQAVVSLNKKFEVIHLVRHFNAWHPAEHRCSQEWKEISNPTNPGSRRALSLHDFAVVSVDSDTNNLQCIWCGMLMDRAALGMHFSEIHSQQILVPNCSLCLQEMVMTARLMEKYNQDFGISLPDEFHLMSLKLGAKYSSEKAMDKAIERYLKKTEGVSGNTKASGIGGKREEDEEQEEERGADEMGEERGIDEEDDQTISITNSQQSFGRRNRLKRKFVKPCFRQICPTNSEFFVAKSACEWRCRLCDRNVYGAVISAGAIKHYKEFHPADIDRMQYELVKARLERIGDGSMEFVHPQLVECLICNLTYALHKPFNICRAIRHLRLKHPEVMPETSGKSISGADVAETVNLQKPTPKRPPPAKIRFGETITDPIELEKFRKENYDQNFDKVQVVYGIKKNEEPAFILLMENEQMDEKTAVEMAEKLRAEEDVVGDSESVGQRLLTPEVENSEAIYQADSVEDVKPLLVEENYSGELEGQEETEETAYVATYDATNPDHVLIEDNEILADENYEMIQDGEEEYQEIEEDTRDVRYLTEEEIREAQARGEILEFEEEVFEEEEDYTGQ